jgi:hypothetical protein
MTTTTTATRKAEPMAESDEEKPKGFTVTDRRGQKPDEPPAQDSSSDEAPAGKGIPEIDFGTFVMSLASSALLHLGELQAPDEPPHPPNLPLAKQTIDILGMLSAKTKGNLTDDENKLLEHLLYDLRLKYVEVKKK